MLCTDTLEFPSSCNTGGPAYRRWKTGRYEWIFVHLCGSLWIFVDRYSQSHLPPGRPYRLDTVTMYNVSPIINTSSEKNNKYYVYIYARIYYNTHMYFNYKLFFSTQRHSMLTKCWHVTFFQHDNICCVSILSSACVMMRKNELRH